MGFIERIFGNTAAKPDSFPWNYLEDREQLEALLDPLATKTVVIFKHSTRCGISSMMLRRFERNWAGVTRDAEFYLLDLIARRELSTLIAQRLQLRHESPQVIVLEGGSLQRTASHGGISDLMPERA